MRTIGLVAALAMTALLLTASEARADKYEVAQCGWHIGAEADWDDSTGGAKFRRDAYCATSQNADPFDGVHMKSFVRPNQAPTVSGTRYARWRWVAPPHTSITKVQGTWWHALHDGFEHRLGTSDSGGRFHVFAADSRTNTTLRSFVAGFSHPRYTFQSRLLCARAASKHCDLTPSSWTSVRAVTLTLEDKSDPGASVGGGILDGGWRRGSQSVQVGAGDKGSGARFGETRVDGGRAEITEFGCHKAMIGGTWKAKRMRPCPTDAGTTHTVDTGKLSDGRHTVRACAEDFAGNQSCTGQREFHVDNNAPTLAFDTGGEPERTGTVVARASDAHSGTATGTIHYRRSGVPAWTELETQMGDDGAEATTTLRAELPVDLMEPGLYELRAEAADAAGNEVASTRRSDGAEMTLRVEPPPPPPPPPPPVETEPPPSAEASESKEAAADPQPKPRARRRARTRLFGRLKRGRRLARRLTVRFGGRARLVGRLMRADGVGAAGRRLVVISRPSSGGRGRVRRRTVVTGRRGGFRVALPAGPSRRVAVRFHGDSGLAPARRPDLALRVRTGVVLRLAKRRLRTGQLLRIGGRVRAGGATLPRRGKLVAIQYYETEARRWSPVLVTRTDHAGRIRARYRFRYVTGTARIRLRAVALPEEGWPYAAGASRPRSVVVKG